MIAPNAFIFAILTALLFGAFGILARRLITKSDYPLAFSVWIGIFGMILSFPIMALEGGTFGDITMAVLAVAFLSTAFSGVFEATQFFARKQLEASRSTILFQLTPLLAFLGSILILGERLTRVKFSGMALIIGGNLVAAYRHGGALNRRGIFFALIAATALACVYIADKFASPHYPIGFYIFISYALPALYVFILAMSKDRVSQLLHELRLATWKLPVLALTSVAGYYFVIKTFRIAEASVVVPIIYTSSIITALGGIILLHERANMIQKLIGTIVVVAGVVLLKQ